MFVTQAKRCALTQPSRCRGAITVRHLAGVSPGPLRSAPAGAPQEQSAYPWSLDNPCRVVGPGGKVWRTTHRSFLRPDGSARRSVAPALSGTEFVLATLCREGATPTRGSPAAESYVKQPLRQSRPGAAPCECTRQKGSRPLALSLCATLRIDPELADAPVWSRLPERPHVARSKNTENYTSAIKCLHCPHRNIFYINNM